MDPHSNSHAPDYAASVIAAQDQAKRLFAEVQKRKLAQPGMTEEALSDRVHALGTELFGVRKYWHKKIVRAGANTLSAYSENPPDLVIGEDDILFFDFGPVFDNFEADFGETVVLGNDPRKHALAADLWKVFEDAKAFYRARPAMTGGELYAHILDQARARGWELGSEFAGHLIGAFPHKPLMGEGAVSAVSPENDLPMNAPSERGHFRHWILEIHLVDRARRFGGFVEDLLTLP